MWVRDKHRSLIDKAIQYLIWLYFIFLLQTSDSLIEIDTDLIYIWFDYLGDYGE